jgi:protein phosphatase
LRDSISGTPLSAPGQGTVWPQSHQILRQAVEQANAVVYATSHRDARFSGMGTTLVSGLFYDNRALIAHVGDSRCYRLRTGQFEQLTRDHSLVQEQIDAGLLAPEEAQESQFKNLVTRAIGVEAGVLVELQEYPALPGDIFLFCSDGLSDMLDPATIAEILAENSQSLMAGACSLVEHANLAGGLDNISVVLVRIRRDFRTNQGLLQRLADWLK